MAKTDGELMLAVARGNSGAFSELFARHGGLVLGYAQKILNDLGRAEDVSQEVWVKLVRAAPSYEDRGQFRSWLLTLVRHQSLNVLRSIQSANLVEAPKDTAPEELIDASSWTEIELELMNRSEVRKLSDVIDALPQAQRTALLLWATEGLSYEEIGTELNLSESSVKSLLFRARQRLQSQLRGVS